MSALRKPLIISIIQNEVEALDGKINFYKGRYCGGKNRCSGLFYLDSDDRPVIKVATGGTKKAEDWIGTLIHEYCHFMQWRDDSKIWLAYESYDVSFEQILDDPIKYGEALYKTIELELDCEKRAVAIIKANNLFNTNYYIKLANALILKYVYLSLYKKWPRTPATNKRIIELMPSKLLKSHKDYINFDKEILSKF